MKKYLIFSGALFMIVLGQFAWADGCPTGYACLLKDTRQQDFVIREMQRNAVKQLYDPGMVEPTLRDKDAQQHSYKDLLPFAPRFYHQKSEY